MRVLNFSISKFDSGKISYRAFRYLQTFKRRPYTANSVHNISVLRCSSHLNSEYKYLFAIWVWRNSELCSKFTLIWNVDSSQKQIFYCSNINFHWIDAKQKKCSFCSSNCIFNAVNCKLKIVKCFRPIDLFECVHSFNRFECNLNRWQFCCLLQAQMTQHKLSIF